MLTFGGIASFLAFPVYLRAKRMDWYILARLARGTLPIERSSEDGAPSNGELNSRKAGKGWKQVPFRAKGLTLGWKHPRGQ